jgi:hypothetical protein
MFEDLIKEASADPIYNYIADASLSISTWTTITKNITFTNTNGVQFSISAVDQTISYFEFFDKLVSLFIDITNNTEIAYGFTHNGLIWKITYP